jgi:formylmethanofuran dehydrogenase subunit A
MVWLMSKKAREATMRRINARAMNRSLLPSISRELTLHEIAVMTRAGQARALGLKNKGHLGVGADGDITVYNINPEAVDPSRNYRVYRKAFRRAAYTIKNGKIVVKDGEVLKQVDGRTVWLDVQTFDRARTTDDMKSRFKEYWTVEYENYSVEEHYLKGSDPIAVKASV